MTLSAEKLREFLDYDPETGVFVRIKRIRKHAAGSVAGGTGGPGGDGYQRIGIFGERYFAHRLAWLMMTGSLPAGEVDHIDRDGTNNKWSNLRDATHAQNLANTKTRRDSSTGLKGVKPKGKRWAARIVRNGKAYHLGVHDTADEAKAAYDAAAVRMSGEFARTA